MVIAAAVFALALVPEIADRKTALPAAVSFAVDVAAFEVRLRFKAVVARQIPASRFSICFSVALVFSVDPDVDAIFADGFHLVCDALSEIAMRFAVAQANTKVCFAADASAPKAIGFAGEPLKSIDAIADPDAAVKRWMFSRPVSILVRFSFSDIFSAERFASAIEARFFAIAVAVPAQAFAVFYISAFISFIAAFAV